MDGVSWRSPDSLVVRLAFDHADGAIGGQVVKVLAGTAGPPYVQALDTGCRAQSQVHRWAVRGAEAQTTLAVAANDSAAGEGGRAGADGILVGTRSH